MRAHHAGTVLAIVMLLFLLVLAPARALSGEPRAATIHRAPQLIDNSAHMDANNLDMVVTNHGSFAFDLVTGSAGLTYPKGSGHTAIFAAGPWIGAMVNGEVRVAVGEYAQEFVPGPMLGGTFLPDDPAFKTYTIVRGNTTDPDYLNWPVSQGAPLDQDGKPLLLGDATMWSVYNDADPSLHGALAGRTEPLGVEIQQTTFAFNRAGSLGNTIFIKFKLTNKGSNTLENAYFSMWSDPDLGGFTDDLVGCDTTLDLGYCYNATNLDEQYGATPPAVGYCLLRGPVVPVSPGVFDTLGMVAFNKYINGTDPDAGEESYNTMRGLFRDGTAIHVHDDPNLPTTTYQVSGDPVTGTGWLDTEPADRRLTLSTGPFRMAPGDVQEIMVAVIMGQGSDRLSSVTALRSNVAIVRSLVDLVVPGVLSATVDLEPKVINLASHAPTVTAYIEIPGFSPASVDLPSLRLAGLAPIQSKTVIAGDHDLDGIADLAVKFSRPALDPLLTPGVNRLELTGSLTTGQRFRGTDEVRVIDLPAGHVTTSISPNPLNPGGQLRFTSVTAGPMAVRMFDLKGRLVRTLMNEAFVLPGEHEIWIDGRGRNGEYLASGVYFYRVDASDGVATGRLVIAK